MSRKKKLVGFYRKHGVIHSIFSTVTRFYDYNLRKQYKAVIVPLNVYSNPEAWRMSEYKDYLDTTTNSLLKKQVV